MLAGVARYMREHEPWDIYLKPYGVEHSFSEWVGNWSGHGIIVAVWTPGITCLPRPGIPVVDMIGVLPGAPLVHTNDASVGRLGADHLLERGYRNFAFVGYDVSWSAARCRGFKDRICAITGSCEVHEFVIIKGKASGPAWWEQQQTRLAGWVRSLPTPIGVMTCTDLLGQQFLEACSRAGVAVPEQVAVIGADNDELICEVANPPLSSVIINDAQRGYEAASLLDKLMAGQAAPERPVYVEPAGVVARASTDTLAIADKDVVAAMQFIRNHACDGIGVADVVEQVPLSRRLLERRFRRYLGRSIYDEIVRFRLNRAVELLCTTELELKAIAPRAGFKSASYMGAVFRARLGHSPGSYRNSAKRSSRQFLQSTTSMPSPLP